MESVDAKMCHKTSFQVDDAPVLYIGRHIPGLSIYLLWFAISDDEDRTWTVAEVSSTRTVKYAGRHRFHRGVDAPTPRRTIRRYITATIPYRTTSSNGARRHSAPVPGD